MREFEDPIAKKTKWTPLKSGGSYFQTHFLEKTSSERFAYKANFIYRLFRLGFVVAGSVLVWGYFSYPEMYKELSNLYLLIIPILLIVTGGVSFYNSFYLIVFDKRSGFFWKGMKSPNEVLNKDELIVCVNLDDIYAFQIISEKVVVDKSSYLSYELNVVLKDGNRYNLVDHKKLEIIRKDAELLSEFLNVPVWDATK